MRLADLLLRNCAKQSGFRGFLCDAKIIRQLAEASRGVDWPCAVDLDGIILLTGMLLGVGRISLMLGIFFAVTGLFVGVGIAKYIDVKSWAENSAGFYRAINKSLPLAVLAAGSIVLCWFVFRTFANVYSGEVYKISRFFFHWEFTEENLDGQSMQQIAGWLYSFATVTLLFVLLMLTTFANWFSYPLMQFKNYSWSQAKDQGNKMFSKHQAAMYQVLGFIFAAVLIGGGIMPLLMPVLYMLVSVLMYVSYRDVFETS